MNLEEDIIHKLNRVYTEVEQIKRRERPGYSVPDLDGERLYRSVTSKIQDRVSILDFIPVNEHAAILTGTSTYNCTAGINAAIVYARATGRTILHFDGKLFNTDGGHIIYDRLQYVGLGMGATTVKLRSGIPIDSSLFVTEYYYAGMAQTLPPSTGTFGFGVHGMTLHGNKKLNYNPSGIARVTTTLTAVINDTQVTIPVVSTTGFTAPGVARIGHELILFKSMTSNSLNECTRGRWRSFSLGAASGDMVQYVPLWGGVGLGLYGAQYVIDDVRIENFSNMGLVSAYDRKYGGTHNYQNSRNPLTSGYADVPDGDTHASIRNIEVLNNQVINMCYLGPHDSHVTGFTIVKDGDDIDGEPYWFPVAGLWVGGTSNPAASIDGAFGTQFSDGHVWGNHSIGIVQATGGCIWNNVQSEGAHIQFNSRAGNAIGDMRIFGISGGRSNIGAWLETGGDMLTIRGESMDYAPVFLGDMATGTGYDGGTVILDVYTNNAASTTLSAAIDDVQTTIPVVATDSGVPGVSINIFPFNSNADAAAGHLSFGIPFDAQRLPNSFTVENEEISYTSYDATNFYGCVRGVNGTVALAHSSGKSVFGVMEAVRGQTAPSYAPERGMLIHRSHYNYEPVRARQKDTFLRRGTGLTMNETRQAFAIGANAAVTDLATKHKFIVSVTETEPKNDYAVISAYGHMLRDTDAPTHTYHGIRSYLDTSFTAFGIKEARGLTAELNHRTVAPGSLVDGIAVFAGAYTAAAATSAVTRLTSVKTGLTHAGTGIVGTGIGVDITTPVGAGTYTALIGVQIANMGRAGTTLSKAIHITAQSGSTTNYAIYSDGGENRVYSGAPGTVPLRVWGHFSQTANLFEFWNRDTSTLMSYFDKDGAWIGVVGSGGSVAWTSVTGTPTTLAGYGITDAAALVHTHAFSSLTGIPTTLTGYGIVGANALAGELTATSTSVPVETVRQTTTNNAMVTTGRFRASLTSGSIVDGFGSQQTFSIGTAAGTVVGAIGAVRAGGDTTGDLVFYTATAATLNERMRITSDGRVGLNNAAISARFQLRAGAAAAGQAPIKFPVGTLLTAVEDGTIEYNATGFYYTHSSTRTAFGAATSVAWSGVTGTPTTLAGYGITDAVALLGAVTQQTWAGSHRFNGSVGIGNDPSATSYLEISPILTDPLVGLVMHRAQPTITITANSALQFIAVQASLAAAPATGTTFTSTNSMRAVYATVSNTGAGTITNAYALFGQVIGNTSGGIITNAFVFRAAAPSLTNGALITNLYGLYVVAQKITGVTTAYGVYQAGVADLNYFAGNIGIGQTSPTALLHLKAGTATANTAPLKFTSGTLLTTPENGAVEYNTTGLYYTNQSGVRQTVAVLETAQTYTAVPIFSAGTSMGLTSTTDARTTSLYIPRMPNLSSPIMLDYTDEFALLTYETGRAVNFSTAPNTGTGAEMFLDDANDTRWNAATSPFPLQIEMDMTTNPINPKASALFRLGITFRTAPTLPMDYTVEVWDTGTSAYVSQQTGTISVATANVVLLPVFTLAISGSFIYKMRITLTGTNPVAAILRIQRIILYHDTHTFDPWHLHRIGGSVFGNVTMHATSPILAISGVAGNNRVLAWQTNYLDRWRLSATDTAEAGSNVGSDLRVRRYSDAGALLDAPLTITRSTGAFQFITPQITLGEENVSAVSTLIRGSVASGYNAIGADLTIQAGSGTGTGGSGDVVMHASAGSASDLDTIVAGTVTTANTGVGGSIAFTFAHTVPAGINRILIVTLSVRGGVDLTGVTYGGVALTKLQTIVNGTTAHAEIWYLVNPVVGTANVICSIAASTRMAAGAMNFTGVRPDAPFGTAVTATGTGTTATVNVTSAANEMVIDIVSKADSTELLTGTGGAGQTERWTNSSTYATASVNSPGGSSTEAGGATVTMSWSWPTTSRAWAIIGVPLRRGTILNTFSERARVGRNGLKLSGSFQQPIRTVTTTTDTVLATDGVVLLDATSNNVTATLPTAVGIAGRVYDFKRIDATANIVTVAGAGAETIDGINTRVLPNKNQQIRVVSDGTNWQILVGRIGFGNSPSIAAGAGAGTGPTVSITNGTDAGGLITVTTGTSPTASSAIVTVTFATPFATAPRSVTLTSANAAPANAGMHISSISTTGFVITSGGNALSASTTYAWYYSVVG